MSQHSREEGSGLNPALEPFSIMIGNWNTTGTHGLFPDTVLHGHVSIEWLEDGAFLLMRSEVDDLRFPSTTAIIGSDDAEAKCYMLTFDVRGVSRMYEVSLHNNVWKWWRDTPGFRQRYEGIIGDDGNTITTGGELSRDGSTWEKDLALTYKRAE